MLREPFAADHPFLPADTFRNDVIIVTGGGTGLGKSFAQMFARMGGRVAIASRDEGHRAAGVAAVEALGGQAVGVKMDVRHPEAIKEAFDIVEAALGPVTVLINNAAGRFMAPAEDTTPNGWRAVTQIVMDGTFFCSQELHRRCVAQGHGGAILNIGATYSWTGGPGSAHSAAAKAAVNSMTQTLAVEWGVDDVRINTLAPGLFPHDDSAQHMRGAWNAQTDRSRQMPAGRVGQLQELAWVATFLCSPFASYVTGHVMVCDGGNWLRHRASSAPDFVPVREWARENLNKRDAKPAT
jgi:NAD(P)-dependent dehydrogenase (short-subunit alcohol dehydrogenase family)